MAGNALHIRLTRCGGHLAVAMDKPREHIPPASLLGRTLDEVRRLLPMVFNICPAAQEAAFDTALGLEPSADTCRRLLVDGLRDHLLALCHHAPVALGETPAFTGYAKVAALAEGSDVAAALRACVFGDAGVPADLRGLRVWAGSEAGAAPAFRAILSTFSSEWGRVELPLSLEGQLDWAAATVARTPADNCAAARWHASALMKDIEAALGRGPIWRLAGRLLEADAFITALVGGPLPFALAHELADGVGCSVAPRGALLVRARAIGGLTIDLARLSPTDFALHPDGAIAKALATLSDVPDAQMERVAKTLIAVYDPCVPTTLTVGDKENA
ncbi:MAG: hypothetical protein AAGD34_00100 [Pseudomonadota bacterium]